MIARRFCPDLSMVRTKSRCSSSSGVSAQQVAKPSTPFMGVRISWLMVARNSLFARFARSAASFAATRVSRARRRSVTSVATLR